ncbi:MAG: hypothetical protein EOP10_00785 [Proteobacteria bacterium]|nr:MAG: hypothetical protein EOP10_00785 [Pseudomonadota bacterium]
MSSVGAIAVSAPLPQFPIVMSVTSSLANGFYKTGQSVPLLVTFSEPVFVTNPGDMQLKVETGSTDQTAIYMSGSGTTALLFLYTVQPGDISSDLDLVSVNPLTLNTALIKDIDGINANLTFVAPGAAGSLSAARAIVIDTIPPTAPGSPTFPSAFTNVSSPSISWTASTDVNFQLYEKKACSSSDCATNCGTAYTTTGLSSTLAGALSPTYYGCIRSKDLASNYSNWVPTANSITLDQTAPTVTNVTSNMADGLYTSGQIEVLMTMSEPIFATNITSINIGMLLVNGTRPIYATSIVSSTILRFLYTIQPGDNTPDLNYCTNCISLGSSTLKDAAGNNANIVLPAIGSASSLGSQKAIAIDAAPPIFTGITNLWRKSETEAQFFWEAARDTTTPTYDIVYEVCQSTTLGSCAASFAVTAVMPQNTFEYTATALTPGVVYEFAVRARDLAGNTTIGTQVQTNKGLSNVTKLRSGTGHSCALLTDGTVKCWGSTYSALLRTPATVAGLSNVVDIALGNLFTCAKLSDQTVKCWGSNTSGQLGDGTITSSAIPVTVLGLTGVQSIAAGTTHACALLADQTVKCWGFNGVGQLGDGTTTTSSSPVLATLTGVTKISLGGSNSCAILTGGSVKCWGSNSYGQIGDGTTTTRITPTTATSVTTAVSVELGTIHACALLSNQTVKCWGANTYGNLGDGTTTTRTTAIVVPSLTAITAISVGDSHTCALNTASTAKCWGINTYGQLGNGTRTNSLSPVDVTDLTNVADLSLTGTNSCALLNNSTVKCWGNGLSGQNGSFANNLIALMPVAIPGLPTLSKLALGEMHTCALLSDGSVSCWGVNNEGQVGSTELNRSTPYPVPGISNVIQLEAGQRHTCALLADQTIRCWGAGAYGELGNGILASNPAPQTVLNISNAVKIYAGLMHTCALLATGTVKCWGQNNQGQLGDGTTTNNSSAVAVTGLSSVADLSLGEVSTCARLTDKTVRCWGSNAYGQFGDGTIVDSLIPVPSLAMGVEKLESGNRHSCAILSDSTVKCWGFNGYYQAGQTVNTPVLTPAPLPTIQNALSVALGAFTSCALLSDQTVKCWGDNGNRQFGVSTSNGPNPIAIGLKGVASLSLGSFHGCAILTDNSARCWGRNDPGMIAKEVFESITTTPRIVAP